VKQFANNIASQLRVTTYIQAVTQNSLTCSLITIRCYCSVFASLAPLYKTFDYLLTYFTQRQTIHNQPASSFILKIKSSANAEGPRDAVCACYLSRGM